MSNPLERRLMAEVILSDEMDELKHLRVENADLKNILMQDAAPENLLRAMEDNTRLQAANSWLCGALERIVVWTNPDQPAGPGSPDYTYKLALDSLSKARRLLREGTFNV